MNQLSIRKNNLQTKKKKKGFTLVELIIVIAIIAVLAAIAIPKFGSVKENSNKSSDIANAKNISLAVSKAIAEGSVTYTTAVDKAQLSSVGGANIENELDGITSTTTLKTTTHKNDTFRVSVDTSGSVSIYAVNGTNAKEIYPITDNDFK